MKWYVVQKYLNDKQWSLRKLSAMSGIPDSTLRMYKFHGSDPSFTNICKIADALDISLDELRDKKVGERNDITNN